MIGDEDKCSLAIKRELEKGPARVRMLSREELKIEVSKYKNISLKIIKEMQRIGQKVPGYANTLAKEMDSGQNKVIGVTQVKGSESNSNLENFDGDSMFDAESEMPDELPDKVQAKIDKQEDQIMKLNLDLKVKNEKILELLSDQEEIKI